MIRPGVDTLGRKRTYSLVVPPIVPTRVARLRDPALALALCALGEYELLSDVRYDGADVWPGPLLLNALVVIPALTLPLAARRCYPDMVCSIVLAGLFVSSAVWGGAEATTTFVLFIVASYSAAAHARHPVPLIGLVAATGVVHEVWDPHVHGPGDVVWMVGIVAISCLVGWAVRTRTIRIGALETAAHGTARRHAAQVAEATRLERAAIARELHDVISHAVAVVVVQAQVGSRALPDDVDRAAQALESIEKNARQAMAELRSLLTVLSDSHEGAGLRPTPCLAQLGELVETFRLAGLRVDHEVEGPLPALEPAADLAAFRVVQEAMTNAVRHAPGTRVALRILSRADGLWIRVADCGPADPSVPVPRGAGRGLAGMQERLELAGGRLLVAGPQRDGFVVEAFVPAGVDTGAAAVT